MNDAWDAMQKGLCPRCKEKGAHFVPPGGGTTGFYMCDPDDKPESSWGNEWYQRRDLREYMGDIIE